MMTIPKQSYLRVISAPKESNLGAGLESALLLHRRSRLSLSIRTLVLDNAKQVPQ